MRQEANAHCGSRPCRRRPWPRRMITPTQIRVGGVVNARQLPACPRSPDPPVLQHDPSVRDAQRRSRVLRLAMRIAVLRCWMCLRRRRSRSRSGARCRPTAVEQQQHRAAPSVREADRDHPRLPAREDGHDLRGALARHGEDRMQSAPDPPAPRRGRGAARARRAPRPEPADHDLLPRRHPDERPAELERAPHADPAHGRSRPCASPSGTPLGARTRRSTATATAAAAHSASPLTASTKARPWPAAPARAAAAGRSAPS